jgi:hypothetical protein
MFKKSNYWVGAMAITLTAFFSACSDEEADDDQQISAEAELLPCGYFNEGIDRTLTNRAEGVDYIIDCQAFVSTDLVIEAGTTIAFESDAGIEVGRDGSIRAVGTSSNGIITLTGVDKVPGSWSGVYVASNDVKNEMVNTVIEYGGGSAFNSNDDRGNFILYSRGKIRMENVTLSHSATFGFNAPYSSAELDQFDFIVAENNQTPVQVRVTHLAAITGGGDFSGNTEDYVKVLAGFAPEGNYTWSALNVPILMQSSDFGITTATTIPDKGNVTLEPGLEMRFSAGVGLRVIGNGSLKAVGTPTNGITLAGLDELPGAWGGIEVRFTENVNNRFEYVTISHAGGANYESAFYLWAGPRLDVQNCTITDITGCAFRSGTQVSTGFDLFTEANNTLTNVSGNSTNCYF